MQYSISIDQPYAARSGESSAWEPGESRSHREQGTAAFLPSRAGPTGLEDGVTEDGFGALRRDVARVGEINLLVAAMEPEAAVPGVGLHGSNDFVLALRTARRGEIQDIENVLGRSVARTSRNNVQRWRVRQDEDTRFGAGRGFAGLEGIGRAGGLQDNSAIAGEVGRT